MRRTLVLLALVASTLALGGGFAPRSAVAAVRDVDAWIDLSTTRPGVGCPIDVSVEVREAGNPVDNVEIELALHVEGSLVSADYGVTNSSGVSFLTLDTSDAESGVGHWLDINLGGEYLTGLSIVTTDGGCGESSKLIETSGEITVVPAADTDSDGLKPSGSGAEVWVPTYVQQRNLSCEFASLYIATSAWGDPISEYAFDDVVGWSPNPHWGYRGDINGAWGGVDDYGVYAKPLSWALAEFGFYGDAFYGGGEASALTSRIDAGIPVLVWLSLWGDQSVRESVDGASFTLVHGEHVMVAYGYDDDGVYLSDPATGTYRFYSWGDFMWMWNVLDGMGLGVSPT
jgi:uncharacterized protein YvpB